MRTLVNVMSSVVSILFVLSLALDAPAQTPEQEAAQAVCYSWSDIAWTEYDYTLQAKSAAGNAKFGALNWRAAALQHFTVEDLQYGEQLMADGDQRYGDGDYKAFSAGQSLAEGDDEMLIGDNYWLNHDYASAVTHYGTSADAYIMADYLYSETSACAQAQYYFAKDFYDVAADFYAEMDYNFHNSSGGGGE